MNEILIRVLLIVGIVFMILGFGSLLVILWIHMYHKFFEESMQKNKIKRIRKRTEKIKLIGQGSISDRKKKYIEKRLNKDTAFMESIQKNEYDGLSIEDIEISERLKKLIDEMISVECYSALRQYITINSKYPITNIDTDISAVSTRVFNGLNSKVSETTTVFSSEYLMNYIVGQTFNLILRIVTDHNASIIN